LFHPKVEYLKTIFRGDNTKMFRTPVRILRNQENQEETRKIKKNKKNQPVIRSHN